MKTLGCIGLLAIVIVGSVFSGWVLSVMWEWFIVPTFDAPSLSIPVAIGLAMIVTFMTYQPQPTNDKELDEQVISALVTSIGKPLIYLGMGYVVTLFL